MVIAVIKGGRRALELWNDHSIIGDLKIDQQESSMSRLFPASPERLAEFPSDFEKSRKSRGYVPNSWLSLVRKPLDGLAAGAVR